MQTASTFVFIGANLTTLCRVTASCYMNLRYSRPIDECKKQFVFFFCSDRVLDQVSNLDHSTREQCERAKFDRQMVFYNRVADEQLARIVTGLFRTESYNASIRFDSRTDSNSSPMMNLPPISGSSSTTRAQSQRVGRPVTHSSYVGDESRLSGASILESSVKSSDSFKMMRIMEQEQQKMFQLWGNGSGNSSSQFTVNNSLEDKQQSFLQK